jgi:hypothetical protein
VTTQEFLGAIATVFLIAAIVGATMAVSLSIRWLFAWRRRRIDARETARYRAANAAWHSVSHPPGENFFDYCRAKGIAVPGDKIP